MSCGGQAAHREAHPRHCRTNRRRSGKSFIFRQRHDGLTGLWNRKAILDMMRREFEIAARSNYSIGVVMLDVDHIQACQ